MLGEDLIRLVEALRAVANGSECSRWADAWISRQWDGDDCVVKMGCLTGWQNARTLWAVPWTGRRRVGAEALFVGQRQGTDVRRMMKEGLP